MELIETKAIAGVPRPGSLIYCNYYFIILIYIV